MQAEMRWSTMTPEQWDWLESVYKKLGLTPDAVPSKILHTGTPGDHNAALAVEHSDNPQR